VHLTKGEGLQVQALTGDCISWARHLSPHIASPQPGVEMVTGKFNAGVNPAMD